MEGRIIKRSGVDIAVHRKVYHSKASETYLDVTFAYPERVCKWSIPIEYRRTGTDLTNASDEKIEDYLNSGLQAMRSYELGEVASGTRSLLGRQKQI